MKVRLYCTRSAREDEGKGEGQCARACVLMHETVKSDPLFKPHPGASRPMQFMYTHTHTNSHTHTYRTIHASQVKLKQAPYCGFVLKPVLTIRVCTHASVSVCLCVRVSVCVCMCVCLCMCISNANLLRSDFVCIFAVPVVCSCCCPCCTILAAFAGFGLFIRFALKRRT